MKRKLALAFALMMVCSSLSAYAAEYKDTPIDQAGDWFATLGKQGLEKDRVLAERKADRMAKFAAREAEKARKEAEKAGKDMQKKLGL